MMMLILIIMMIMMMTHDLGLLVLTEVQSLILIMT